jgi:transcriptional regulator with XRE-family HTH domain
VINVVDKDPELARLAAEEFESSFGPLLRAFRDAGGMRQLDLATELSVDHSLVSRWEKGHPLPSGADVQRIAEVLKLDSTRADRLHFAWLRSRAEKEREERGTNPEQLLVRLDVSIDCARQLRKSGQPRLAFTLSERDAQTALEAIRAMPWSPGHVLVLESLTELLAEQCKAGLDYLPRAIVRTGALEPAIRTQERIASLADSELIRFFRDLSIEGAAYVAGNVGKSHEIGRELLRDMDSVPLEWLPEVIRAAAINAGRLGDRESLEDAELALRRGRERAQMALDGATYAFILEGFGRAWGGVEPKEGVDVINRAWDSRDVAAGNGRDSLLRFVQLVRSQAEVEIALGSHSNVEDVRAKIERALSISRREKYDRYVTQLERLGERLESR